ncbi:MAG: hypothetical protein E7582_05780 [Ruminococcaceae bacterium]|nr:hypothetical protein [Oscillospiraceae bacterium]
MKKTIFKVKQFVCFYLTIPMFIFLLLVSGVGVMGKALIEKSPEEGFFNFMEKDGLLHSSDSIINEPTSPEGSFPIVAKDMSKDYNILNSTSETIDEEELLSRSLPYKYTSDGPMVLVVHTHGSECYAEEYESFSTADTDGYHGFYTVNSSTRSLDCDKNIVAVGEAFCKALADAGIKSIQSRIMHDKDDYNTAYANSRKTILEYLKKYPTIKYVIDVHRDSLGEDGSEKIKTVASEIEGSAQVMLVAGCQGNGVIHSNWEDNLSVNLKFKKAMDNKYPSLSRPIYLRYSRYNLDLTKGSLLLEIGTCSNTLKEAIKAAELAGECFADMLLE